MGTRVVEEAATMPIVLWLIQFDSQHEGELPMRTAIAITSSSYELTAARKAPHWLPVNLTVKHSLLRPVPFRCKTLNCYPLAHQLAEHPNLWLPGNCICLATFLSFSCLLPNVFYLFVFCRGRAPVGSFAVHLGTCQGSEGRRKYIFALPRLYSWHLLGIFHGGHVFESMAS